MIGSVGIFGLTLLLASVSIGGLSVENTQYRSNEPLDFVVSQTPSMIYEDTDVIVASSSLNNNLYQYPFDFSFDGSVTLVECYEDGTKTYSDLTGSDRFFYGENIGDYLPASCDSPFGYVTWNYVRERVDYVDAYESCLLMFVNSTYYSTNLGRLVLDAIEFDFLPDLDMSDNNGAQLFYCNVLGTDALLSSLLLNESEPTGFYSYTFNNLVSIDGAPVGLSRTLYMPYYFRFLCDEGTDLGTLNVSPRLCFNYKTNGGFTSGYNTGYYDGYNAGLTDGDSNGYNNGYQTGYNEGYANGINVSQSASFLGLFGAIADTPVMMLQALFSFDLFGTSMLVIIMSLLTGIIVLYLVKKVWK